MDVTTVAVDLAKEVFQVALANRAGRVIERRRLTRGPFTRLFDELARGTRVIMEACGTAHYWGREAQARGLEVRLLPPQYVRPYVRRNKTDRADCDALLEADRCGEIRPVPVKSVEQQSLQAVHRIRTQWQTTRVARLNGIRGLLAEHGYVLARGARTVLSGVTTLLADAETTLPAILRQSLTAMIKEVRALEAQIEAVDRKLAAVATNHPVAARLQTIPGVGVLTATALVASVPHIEAFPRGRQFASWLGLTPRESSSGSRRTLGQVSKRGDVHLRCLLVHGARAVLRCALLAEARRPDRLTRLQQWALATAQRRGRRKATVALANKLARVVWAVWRREDSFHATPAVAA